MYDLLNAAPELFAAKQLHLLEPLGNSLKDVSETMRIHVAQVYGILWAFGLPDEKFDEELADCLNNLSQKTLEHKHGWLLVVGHTFNRKIAMLKQSQKPKDYATWPQFVNAVKIICEFFSFFKESFNTGGPLNFSKNFVRIPMAACFGSS